MNWWQMFLSFTMKEDLHRFSQGFELKLWLSLFILGSGGSPSYNFSVSHEGIHAAQQGQWYSCTSHGPCGERLIKVALWSTWHWWKTYQNGKQPLYEQPERMRAILPPTMALLVMITTSEAYFSVWLLNPGVYDVVATELSFSDGSTQNIRSVTVPCN